MLNYKDGSRNMREGPQLFPPLPGFPPHIPLPLQGLTRVEEMTVLGVTFTHTLSFAPHVLEVTGKSAAFLYDNLYSPA